MELWGWGFGVLPLDDVVWNASGADLAEGGGGTKWAEAGA
jgi:hypothetical protein